MNLFLNIRYKRRWGWFWDIIWWYFHRGIERHRRAKYHRRYSKYHYVADVHVHRDGFILGKRISYAGEYACIYSQGKKFYVHILVASCFARNPDKKPVINHINGRKFDNRWLNLEGVTYAANSKHAYRIGLSKNKLTYNEAQDIKQSKNSNRELSVQYGVTVSHIKNIKNGYCWNH